MCFDIDDTLISEKSPDKNGLYHRWNEIQFHDNPYLCFNTGRLVDDTLRLVRNKVLPEPDFMICGVGTEIFDFQKGAVIKKFSEILEEGWDLEKVSEVINKIENIEKQPAHYQNTYKSSWFLDDATPEQLTEIRKRLIENGLEVNVVYSSKRHLDILPKWANKGNALEWLLKHLNIPPSRTIVAGNSGNDSAMFRMDGVRGIIVANAHPELIKQTEQTETYLAEKSYFEGILEGLSHYDLNFDLKSNHDNNKRQINLDQLNLMEIEAVTGIEKSELAFIQEAYHKAIGAIKKNITPIGFSACSLEDNDTNGTDTNYESVWARDGAITICGTIPLVKDEEIFNCQRKTFETLLANISPAGQVPANVRIASGEPDYSGVGGICSIDSGLWLIIAFYDFIKASGDLEFLRNNFELLSRIMNWLSAQDGNNDALLEIPEAGDWTDLFGRSYNVLYDEVLWYRANICFGRMLELLGSHERAGDYIRWSGVIKKEIIRHFWPSTSSDFKKSNSFDEQQFSLGDARYLIAQITPFNFSWRCDVYGNILAYLYDVLDTEKAITTFRFLWGAGVNDPFPVQNVYPAVTPGDPDWRAYYTVNLLNLPHHYHNGGIWPFVGGDWVRFVNRLGMKDLALKELFKLAELNKLGIFNEWEFNEWCHGITGRPMGKSFQSWSAASFIKACHDLNLIKE